MSTSDTKAEPLIAVRNLSVAFHSDGEKHTVVDRVTFDIGVGEVLGIVGESGSGKSVTALSVLRLVATPPGQILSGSIRFQGQELMSKSVSEMRQIRGGAISMIFQEPMSSLNPVFTIGQQIGEVVRLHHGVGKRTARDMTLALLDKVGMAPPKRRIDQYPHELSGGMRQRAMIALALSGKPKLLLADEPTTALDVTVQAQILDLLRKLQAEYGIAIMLITHDLGVVAEFAHRVIVMYAGRIVEEAPAQRIFSSPAHPYTEGLLRSIPRLDTTTRRLPMIPGTVPSPGTLVKGCRFAPRCQYCEPACEVRDPPMISLDYGQAAACIRHTKYGKSPTWAT